LYLFIVPSEIFLTLTLSMKAIRAGSRQGTGPNRQLLRQVLALEKEIKVLKLPMAAALVAALTIGIPALAQTNAAQDARHEDTRASGAATIQPDQIRAEQMVGSSVYDMQNRNIGKVKDLILDKRGNVASVIVDVGSVLGIGGKNVAVNWSEIKADNNRLTLDRTKDQLQQMAEYRLEDRDTGAGTSASPTTGGRLGH
jgi:sporulation protein YlmC with PRC-barrel domain